MVILSKTKDGSTISQPIKESGGKPLDKLKNNEKQQYKLLDDEKV